jgi:hypothetical protein
MQTWLRSLVNAIVGKVPGKTGRLDTATRMAMDADFSNRREPTPQPELPRGERDDGHLVKGGMLADVNFLEELIRIVKEAQGRDADDERRLYNSMVHGQPSYLQRQRPDQR